VKILALSDLHGNLPDIPPCDLLLLAGDICPDKFPEPGGKYSGVTKWPDRDGQIRWFYDTFLKWLDNQPAKRTLLTWGNHDFAGPSINVLDLVYVDTLVEHEGLKIWMSPWVLPCGPWAYLEDELKLRHRYDQIPDGTDIIVSHGPPFGFGDKVIDGHHVGSISLLSAIDRVKPKAVVCGHIHEDAGIFRHFDTTILNVSHVDYFYRPVRGPQQVNLL
jgi:hypothetical protein